MINSRLGRWATPAAAMVGVTAVALGGASLLGPENRPEPATAASAPYPFVISQDAGLLVGTTSVAKSDGLIWADVAGNSLLLLTTDPNSPGSFATLSRAALDGTGVTQLMTGVMSVPLVNATTATVTVMTRQALDVPTPTLKKVSVNTGAVLDQIIAPIGSLLSTLKPNGQALIASGIDELLWNTVQDLLQLLGEPGAVATHTIVSSATSSAEFHADIDAGTSYVVARPSGEHVRTFTGALDGTILGENLVLWDVEAGTIHKTSASDAASPMIAAPSRPASPCS